MGRSGGGSATRLRVGAARSQVEGELVEVHIARDGSNLGTEARNLVCKHARSGDLDGIIPVVVVVAQGVREVQDGHLGDLRRVLSHIEVSWLNTTLCD